MCKLSDFDYILPKELIAQHPLNERDSARLLVVERKSGNIKHCIFKDLTGFFKPNDLLVLNNTKVMPCRLKGKRRSGGKVEVFLLKQKEGKTFEALLKPTRLKLGEKINFNASPVYAEILSRNEVAFNTQDLNKIYGLGAMPLPPYIKREAQDLDNIYYQTIYAKENGAVASPTAGLHFTEELLKKINKNDTAISYVTLHVGLGTFKPVKSEDITQHKMEKEYFKVPDETINAVTKARKFLGRVIAVGTTSLRALESFALGKKEGETDLFIYPGFDFKVTDCLLTNFHLPRTTLFMLVCAFAGCDLMKKAYREAIDNKYRFYSYGDAMLII
ncbi:MAG: tRNA preQ1(34) S-adenosylmethionine ribosyltransferase-isomerase QueA [Candidatus Omnitrophota bacterium]|jgi:S-adenosylmethionine:tRNA ribosyltransferase-isomerase